MTRSTDPLTRTIISIDGEGKSDADAVHHYTLLAAYNDHGRRASVLEAASIGTESALAFLLGCGRGDPLIVAYGFNYDVNMLLRDLPKPLALELHLRGETVWGGYLIEWAQGHTFRLRHVSGKRVTVWDVYSHFKAPFWQALEQYRVGTPEERADILRMKAKRDRFHEVNYEEIKRYCLLECRLLTQLVRVLLDDARNIGLHPARYDGPGTFASELMRTHAIRDYLHEAPGFVQETALASYFGGRIDVSMVGHSDRLYGYDLHSAYPSGLAGAFCPAHTTYERTGIYDPDALGLWHVCWDIAPHPWPALPFRQGNGRVYYPLNGSGWYWSFELEAARQLHPTGRFTVDEGIILLPGCEHTPFAWVESVYALRQTLAAAGNPAERIIKAALNTLYGKLAQSIGQGKEKPPYQSFLLASYVTAQCRTRVLSAINAAPGSVFSVSTDGILSDSPMPLDRMGQGLGEWEAFDWEDVFIAQPGIYDGWKEGKYTRKTRGFARPELDFSAMREAYNESDGWGQYSVDVRRFIGVGHASLGGAELPHWRSWITARNDVSFTGGYRFPAGHDASGRLMLSPVRHDDPGESAPYDPPRDWLDAYERDTEDARLERDQP